MFSLRHQNKMITFREPLQSFRASSVANPTNWTETRFGYAVEKLELFDILKCYISFIHTSIRSTVPRGLPSLHKVIQGFSTKPLVVFFCRAKHHRDDTLKRSMILASAVRRLVEHLVFSSRPRLRKVTANIERQSGGIPVQKMDWRQQLEQALKAFLA